MRLVPVSEKRVDRLVHTINARTRAIRHVATRWRTIGWTRPALNLVGHHRRRIWITGPRVHLESRSPSHPHFPAFVATLRDLLSDAEGVRWVGVNALLGRVVIELDGRIDVPALEHILEHAEVLHGLEGVPFSGDEAEHPADLEPLLRTTLELGSSLASFGIGLVFRVVDYHPPEGIGHVSRLLTVVDNTPRLRRLLEKRVGPVGTDLGLSLIQAGLHAVTGNFISSLVNATYRAVQLLEGVGRFGTWERWEPRLHRDPAQMPSEAREVRRPVPLPNGPVEAYSEDAWYASLGGFAVGVADTHSLKRAISPILDVVPKPARLGRETFAAFLGLELAGRDILCLQPAALRLLDRVDCIVMQERLLFTGMLTISKVIPLGHHSTAELARHLSALFQPDMGETIRHERGWRLGPLAQLDLNIDDNTADRIRALNHGPTPVLGLAYRDRIRALVQTKLAADPATDDLIAKIRHIGHQLVIAYEDETVAELLKPDLLVPDGPALANTVQELQRDGRVVCVIARGDVPAFAGADCAIALYRPEEPIAWSAHILCRGGLEDVRYLMAATGRARKASRQAVKLALAGSCLGGFTALRGLKKTSPDRVMLAVNGASLVSVLNGMRIASNISDAADQVRADPTPWHMLEPSIVLNRLRSSMEGLSPEEALRRLGAPRLTDSLLKRLSQSVVGELSNPLTPVLAAGAAISAIVESVADAGLIASVVVLNALIGGFESFRAEEAIARMERVGAVRARVRRGGNVSVVDGRELVAGDVLLLRAGEMVPADCRLLEASGLEVDEASLTGESLPVSKSPPPSLSAAIAERSSMLYEGTSLVAGTATAAVVAVGEATEARRGLRLTREGPPSTGVERRLNALTDLTIPLALGSGAAIMVAGLMREQDLRELVGSSISLAVAAVPEGLPLLATVAQLSAARRLSSRGVLVRNARAMEALGRVDVVCADKTGTLTEGQLQVRVVFDGRDTSEPGALSPSHRFVLAAGMRATPAPGGQHEVPQGTDRALLEGAARASIEVGEGRTAWQRLHELPFKAERRFYAVLGRIRGGLLISVKGAPEALLERCTSWWDGKRERPLDEARRRVLESESEGMARVGLRVLAIAERTASSPGQLEASRIQGLTFLGFVGMSDVVRATSAPAIARLVSAGVRVVMITGDHPCTAEQIGAQLGLPDGDAVLTGPEIDELDEERLEQAIERVSIIARATPNQKVRIVRALQHRGHVVAMTGDGANDAPAIRLADVGIALGKRATPAARSAADLVVLDERIETIVDAVLEGRAMWGSVRDAVSILAGGNLGEIGFALVAGLLSEEPALNSRQLLLVNLLTDVAPAMAIAVRPPRDSTPEAMLREGPEVSLGDALDREILWRAVITASSAWAAWLGSRVWMNEQRASTVGLLSLVGAQLGQTLVTGKPTPLVVGASLGSAAVLLAVVETPGLSQLFGCRPLGPIGLLTAATATVGATGAALVAPPVIDLAITRIKHWKQLRAEREHARVNARARAFTVRHRVA